MTFYSRVTCKPTSKPQSVQSISGDGNKRRNNKILPPKFEPYSYHDVELWIQGKKVTIDTIVTRSALVVDWWIANIYCYYKNKLDSLFIGLDTEWCPYKGKGKTQPVAILQLCVGKQCLVFQILHSEVIPSSLVEFLGNPKFTFVGKEVNNDAKKLLEDYQLHVKNTEDVAHLAAEKYNDKDLKNNGLKTLARVFLSVVMDKSKDITLSNWANLSLTQKQIEYACVDAFISLQLGLELKKSRVEDGNPIPE